MKNIGKVLLVFVNHPMEPLMPLGVSLLATVLEDSRFEVRLFDTTLYPGSGNDDQLERQLSGQIKEADYSNFGVIPKDSNIFEDFTAMVSGFTPDLIAFSCVEATYKKAIAMAASLGGHDIPVVFGGVFASFAPKIILASGLVDAVCVGEGENAIVAIARRALTDRCFANIPNVWTKEEGNIVPPAKFELVDINSLPIPRFDVFEPTRIYRSMAGKIYRMIPIEISRGCPYQCTYCSAPAYRQLFSQCGKWLRFKTIENIIKQVDYYVKNYAVEYIYFIAETFLAMPASDREIFYRLYNKYQIPFWFNTRPETILPQDIASLEKVGCHRVSVGVEHGNEVFRRKMLKRFYSNDSLVAAIRLICDSEIQISVNNMIGFPDETRELVFDTINLNREFFCDSHTVSVFQPYVGTALYEYCVEKNYWGAGNVADESFSQPVLNMPSMGKQEIKGLYRTFNLYRVLPKSLWEEIRIAEIDDERGNQAFRELSRMAVS